MGGYEVEFLFVACIRREEILVLGVIQVRFVCLLSNVVTISDVRDAFFIPNYTAPYSNANVNIDTLNNEISGCALFHCRPFFTLHLFQIHWMLVVGHRKFRPRQG